MRDTVYWPNINADIEQMCKQCNLCQQHQSQNKRQPMLPYEIPTKPWQHIATDIFQIRDKFYLLTVDLYSKYPLLEQLSSPVSSKQITEKIKSYCSMFGKPSVILSDNGPQYTGEAFKNFMKSWALFTF